MTIMARSLGSWRLLVLAAAIAWGQGCSSSGPQGAAPAASPQVAAVRELARQDTDEAARALVEVTVHEDTKIAREAVSGLARMRTPAAARALVQVAQTERRAPIRLEVAVALGYQATPEAVQELRTMVRSEPDSAVRGAAAASLGRAGAFRDALLLLDQAERENDLDAQGREVAALEQLMGLRFGFNPKGSREERRKVIERIRRYAPQFVERLDKYSPVKKGPGRASG